MAINSYLKPTVGLPDYKNSGLKEYSNMLGKYTGSLLGGDFDEEMQALG